MSRDLLRAQILDRLRRVSVRRIEVGGLELYVRGLTGAERLEVQMAATAAGNGGPPLSDFRVAALGLCDESGARLFDNPDDVAALDGAVLARIAREVIEASGLSEGAREDAEKN